MHIHKSLVFFFNAEINEFSVNDIFALFGGISGSLGETLREEDMDGTAILLIALDDFKITFLNQKQKKGAEVKALSFLTQIKKFGKDEMQTLYQ